MPDTTRITDDYHNRRAEAINAMARKVTDLKEFTAAGKFFGAAGVCNAGTAQH